MSEATPREPRVWVGDQRPEGGSLPVDLDRVVAAAATTLAAEGRPDAGLSVTLVDDAAIAELHQQYLGVEGPTDVISFPLDDEDEAGDPLGGGEGPEPLLGEVVVSVDTAAREAAERGLPFERELLLYVIHGALHLLGYDDRQEPERARMHARQEALLEAFLSGRGDFPSQGE